MKNFGKSVLLALTLMPVLTQRAKAADGSSGCGPAWYVFKDNSLVSSSLRSTTNGFLSPIVTLGMTFGTSNCAKHKIVMEEKEAIYFATTNYSNLMIEMAQGRGQFLGAFAETMGCGWRAMPVFADVMQAEYSSIFAAKQDPAALVAATRAEISRHSKLAGYCGSV